MLSTEPALIFDIRGDAPLGRPRNQSFVAEVPRDHTLTFVQQAGVPDFCHTLRMYDALQLETRPQLSPLRVGIFLLHSACKEVAEC